MPNSTKSSFDAIYNIVSRIPKGKVTTYKNVAILANIASPRFIGKALHNNTDPVRIPCHRVVRSNGSIAKGYAFGGEKKQKELLKKEGVSFITKDKVDLKKSLYYEIFS